MSDQPAPTVRELLASAEAQSVSRFEAEVLLAKALGWSRTRLHTWPDSRPDSAANARYHDLVQRRVHGEPIAHITGTREFWSLELAISPDTLIPRPETELLVELALAKIPADAEWAIADLGTGSGAIALAIASERPRCQITASDNSVAALSIAAVNARRLHLENIRFVHGDWWIPFAGQRFHMVLSNPPYIADDDPHLVRGDLPHEPRAALASGPDGMDAIRAIAACAIDHLQPRGWLLLEHGFTQGMAVRRLLQHAGLIDVQTHRDLAGNERSSLGQAPD